MWTRIDELTTAEIDLCESSEEIVELLRELNKLLTEDGQETIEVLIDHAWAKLDALGATNTELLDIIEGVDSLREDAWKWLLMQRPTVDELLHVARGEACLEVEATDLMLDLYPERYYELVEASHFIIGNDIRARRIKRQVLAHIIKKAPLSSPLLIKLGDEVGSELVKREGGKKAVIALGKIGAIADVSPDRLPKKALDLAWELFETSTPSEEEMAEVVHLSPYFRKRAVKLLSRKMAEQKP
ncbi:MAG TPA: hypothetical protein VJK09_01325 [Candidatus Paceibacterota bacterium]